MSTPADPLAEHAFRLLEELRELGEAPHLGDEAGELLLDGYAAALALEGARRKLRAQALALSERELRIAAQERELRALLRALRQRIASTARSGDEPAPQRLH